MFLSDLLCSYGNEAKSHELGTRAFYFPALPKDSPLSAGLSQIYIVLAYGGVAKKASASDALPHNDQTAALPG